MFLTNYFALLYTFMFDISIKSELGFSILFLRTWKNRLFHVFLSVNTNCN